MNSFTIFLVLITIVSLLLIFVIMIQNPKGGGLDSSLGGSTNIGGVQNTNKFLDNSTWTLASALILLVLFSSLSFTSGNYGDSKILDESAVIPAPAVLPAATSAPENAPAQPAAEPVKIEPEAPAN